MGPVRILWIDAAKGASILLVVLWHSYLAAKSLGDFPEWLENTNRALAAVRMPVFFLTSGVLLSPLLQRSWDQLLLKRTLPMFWILCVWTLIGSALNLVVQLYPWGTRTQPGLAEILWTPQGNLWFVYALIVFAPIAWLAATLAVQKRVMLLVAVWLALLAYHAARDEHFTSNIMQSFPFYAAGVFLAPWLTRVSEREAWLLGGLGLLSLLVVWFSVSLKVLPSFLVQAGYKIAGTTLALSVIVFVQRLPVLARLLSATGRNSLAIFVGHVPVIAISYAWAPERLGTVPFWLGSAGLAIGSALTFKYAAQQTGLGWLYTPPEMVFTGFRRVLLGLRRPV